MEKPTVPVPPGAAPAVTRMVPPSVTTQITRTMPLAQALQLGIRNAGKDPDQAWAVFDVHSATMLSDPQRPQPGTLYVVAFLDWTYCEIKMNGGGYDAANEQGAASEK